MPASRAVGLDADITAIGGVMARQVWLARGNNGNIFVFSDNMNWDINPFRARFEIHETISVLSDVAGGGGGAIDVSGIELEEPTEADKGNTYVDAYKHDFFFPVRKQRAGTPATGTGAALVHLSYAGETTLSAPATDSVGVYFLHLPSDTWRVTYASAATNSTQWRIALFSTAVAVALGLIVAPITDVEYIGQFDDANDAAAHIPSNSYEATTGYYFHNRSTNRVEFLSAYVAPLMPEEYWEHEHLLTEDNRNNARAYFWLEGQV